MSSTNKTNYYKLSQYIGTDKPTYLGDYNTDMSKIDAGIHEVQETATTANQTAGSAEAKVTALSPSVEALQNDMAGVKASVQSLTVDNAQNKKDLGTLKEEVSSVKTTANGAQSEVTNLNADIERTLKDTVTPVNGLRGTINAGYNTKMNLISINGHLSVSSPTTVGTNISVGKLPSSIPAPSSNKTFYFVAGLTKESTSNYSRVPADITIDTNGNIIVSNPLGGSVYDININLMNFYM
jgi:hypothetical protein